MASTIPAHSPESAGHATTLVDLGNSDHARNTALVRSRPLRPSPSWSDWIGAAGTGGHAPGVAGGSGSQGIRSCDLRDRSAGQGSIAGPGAVVRPGAANRNNFLSGRAPKGLKLTPRMGGRTVPCGLRPSGQGPVEADRGVGCIRPGPDPGPGPRLPQPNGLGLETGGDGFIGPDNVLFLSAVSNRAGVAIVGPARGSDDPDVIRREMHSAADELDRLLRPVELPEGRLVVDRGRCTICLTCFRFCPAMAIAFTNRPWAEPMACVECGLCVAECPMDALQLEDYSGRPGQGPGWKRCCPGPGLKQGPPRIVLFGCRRSAVAARAAAPESKIETDRGFRASALRRADRRRPGADRICHGRGRGCWWAACHEGNCRSGRGSGEARRRSGHTADLLAEAGLDPQKAPLHHAGSEHGLGIHGRCGRVHKGTAPGRGIMTDEPKEFDLDQAGTPAFAEEVASQHGAHGLRQCYACGSCSASCPVGGAAPGF